jgi:glycosyltransferase involved in cell wall biosynthesis
MKILTISNRYPPWSLGGYEAIAAGAVHALRSAGHRVRVLTTMPDPSDRRSAEPPPEDVHRELAWYWRAHQFPARSLGSTVALERENAAVLARHLDEVDPDVVLWWAMGGMSLSLLERVRRAGVPAVGVVGDDWMAYGPAVDAWIQRFRGWRGLGAGIAERLLGIPATVELGAVARWLCMSEHLRTRAIPRTADAVVAHPGVEPERFRRQDAGAWSWRLLYCGRIDPRKGVDTGVEALAHLPADAALTIHGQGEPHYRAQLESTADGLGLAGRVRFQCSDHRDVPAVYAAADAIVFPVRWQEPWGLVPLEAMAVGRPVVASTSGGGAAEYLRDEDNCLQFPPGDASALAAALRRLAADPELRDRLIAGGAETAARFTAQAFHETLQRELLCAVDGPQDTARALGSGFVGRGINAA